MLIAMPNESITDGAQLFRLFEIQEDYYDGT